jgi:hypothetical protein
MVKPRSKRWPRGEGQAGRAEPVPLSQKWFTRTRTTPAEYGHDSINCLMADAVQDAFHRDQM